jgi:SAM-dependent methyltransferase
MAEQLIPDSLRGGLIVDVGCGAHAAFLRETQFQSKIGIDKLSGDAKADEGLVSSVRLIHYDIASEAPLPLENRCASVVTMLAVIEHLEPHITPHVMSEVHRVLRGGGVFIMTTPAPWTAGLLRLMAKCGLVSIEEIDEHKSSYSIAQLRGLACKAGFEPRSLKSGFFLLGCNQWMLCRKPF